MTILARKTLGTAVATAWLAGCGGGQSVAPNAAARSWISPTAARSDLVYVTYYSAVSVYSYPRGERVGALKGFYDVVALCSDTSGNVWVIDAHSSRHSTLLEYAHDGSAPIATLSLNARGADTCSVDPSTGNLAVGTQDSEIAIWSNGQGSPSFYSTRPFFKKVNTIAYDSNGDLYMRSYDRHKSGAWLPKGGSAAMPFSITQVGAYAWDGQYLAIAPLMDYSETLTLYNLDGGSGQVAGSVWLKRCDGYYPSLSIAGSALAISCGLDETASLDFYKYPAGGKPIKTVYGVGGRVAISVAPSL